MTMETQVQASVFPGSADEKHLFSRINDIMRGQPVENAPVSEWKTDKKVWWEAFDLEGF